MSKKIVINIHEDGYLKAETFGMQGTECIDELDKLMKGLTNNTTRRKKSDYYKEKITSNTIIKVNNNG